jgi:hypothetical protein
MFRSRPDWRSLFRKWLTKNNLAVDRDDREDQRKALAVAVGPCGSDFGAEAIVALVGDMPCHAWKAGVLGSVVVAVEVRAMINFLSFRFGSLPPFDRPRETGRRSCPARVNAENRRGPAIDARLRSPTPPLDNDALWTKRSIRVWTIRFIMTPSGRGNCHEEIIAHD